MKNKKVYTENWSNEVSFSIKYDKLLHSEKSEFQKIDFYKSKENGIFFTLDDLMMVAESSEFMYHDMIVHPSMAVNPNIKNVLIIGGGDGGTAREVTKYKNVKQIDVVEIDERVVRLCQKYLPSTADQLDKDKRINLYFEDGIEFVKKAKDSFYDLVIVDSTDPISIGEGLFTEKFYKDVFRILTKDGILINQKENAFFDKYANEMKKSHNKLKKIFPIVETYMYQMPVYPSGLWLFGFASKSKHPIKDFDAKYWNKLKLKTKYYNTNIHSGAFMLPNYILEKLDD